MIGKSLSHYKVTSKLGEGGMGEVFVAEDSTGLPTLTMTQQGLVVGTVPYMSPEQVRGEDQRPPESISVVLNFSAELERLAPHRQ